VASPRHGSTPGSGMSAGGRGYTTAVKVWIGTSGWQYRHWRPGFYAGVPSRRWLAHYTANFDTVELNGSFYRLPDRSRFEHWATEVPEGFVMAVKMSRYLTHVRRLADPREPVDRFVRAATGLGDHLGPVLVQLPPSLRADADALDAVLRCFPAEVRVAVELRHPSWFTSRVCDLLHHHGAAFVEADRQRPLGPDWRTAGWRYVRFHVGRARPSPCYGRTALESWAERLAGSDTTYAYFNNDPNGCAVRDARLFARAVERHGLTPTRVPPARLTPVPPAGSAARVVVR
jgi:uncharacterized protein YecE (DUF72 family)